MTEGAAASAGDAERATYTASTMLDLAGKAALVTGGGRRLGAVIAQALAAAGVHVAVHHRSSADEALEVVRAIARAGGRAVTVAADLARGDEARALPGRAADALGAARLDVLVNNASVFRATPLEEVTEADWDAMMDVNLKAPFLCALAAARLMGETGGVIINLVDASVETPWPSYVPYQVSKAGLHALTGYLARALAPRVRVNGVAPGPILPAEGTGEAADARAIARVPLKRWGDPQDVADAVLYLARAPYVTGVVIPVDGGRRLG